MDVTPRELRDSDIREAWRGYSREEVDDLLERAAAAIERQAAEVAELNKRMRGLETEATRTRETEDMLHRTLLLAQRTADEAVTEAQTRSRKLVEDAETKAHMLVSDAEATARRTIDTERQRLETEVRDLGARRDALQSDIANLEAFEAGYRARLREVIEADLGTLEARGPAQATAQPALHEVEIPPERPAPDLSGARAGHQGSAADGEGDDTVEDALPGVPPAGEIGRGMFGPPRPETAPAVGAPAPAASRGGVDDATEALPAPPRPPAAAAPGADARGTDVDLTGEESTAGRARLFVDEPVDPAALTDDAFFASLREAVDSDAPLGPSDAPEPGPRTPTADFVDLDDTGSRLGNAFRRRR